MLHAVDDALRSSFREIYPRLFRFVFSRTNLPAGDVDDLVQETLAHGWQQRREFLESSSFETWLLSIARHKIADFWRRRSRSRDADVARALSRLDETPIAEHLGDTESAIESRLTRARDAFRKLLGEPP